VPTSSSHATPQRVALVCQVLAARHRVAHPDTVVLQRRHPPAWTGLRKLWIRAVFSFGLPARHGNLPCRAGTARHFPAFAPRGGDACHRTGLTPKCSVTAYLIQRALGPAINPEDRCAPHQHYRYCTCIAGALHSCQPQSQSGADGVLTRNRNRLKPVSHPDAAEGWN
jgi:hypothetical protein